MRNDIEISTLKTKNELKIKKEFIERMNKSSEDMKYFEDLLRSPRSINDTSRLGYISTFEKEESSINGEKKNTKGKPTCHHYGKIRHKNNICRSKNENQSPKQNTKG